MPAQSSTSQVKNDRRASKAKKTRQTGGFFFGVSIPEVAFVAVKVQGDGYHDHVADKGSASV